ncbi:MAG: type I restriction endonuclease [Thermoguttaceae bacterium]
MDFKDQVKQLGERIHKLKANISTEEATKTAFVMPMIQILGYDVFNPLEVVPEFTCDIGVKKGEKIDYAILENGTPLLLLECKHWNKNLNLHEGQLLRYFQVSKAKFGVLTNGIVYRFYTDLERTNLMDEKPFLEVNITSIKSNEIEELKKFHKSYFDLESIISSATDLKYMGEIKGIITSEMASPSDWFIRGIARNVYPGSVTTKVVEQFSELIAQSFVQVINGMVTSRLESALSREEESRNEEPILTEEMEDGIITTEEELEGY